MNSRYQYPTWRWTLGVAVALTVVPAGRADHEIKLPPSAKRAADPIVCDGNREVVLEGRSIWSSGAAVVVAGNCEVLIRDSHIRAAGVAIRADGNADILIVDSFVQGRDGAVYAGGNAEVEYRNSTFRGGVGADGNAELADVGGNLFERIPGSADYGLTESGAVECGDRDRLTMVHRYIRSDLDGITLRGDCELLLSDSFVDAGAAAVRVVGDGVVRVRNTTLRGDHAVLIEADGGVHVAGSNLDGRVEPGGGSYIENGGNIRGDLADRIAHRGPVSSVARSDVPGSRARVKVGSGGVEVSGGREGRGGRVRVGPGGVEVRGRSGKQGSAVKVGPGGIEIEARGDGVAREPIESCSELCELWPALTSSHRDCVAAVVDALGYPIEEHASCVAVDTEAQCRVCARTVDLEDRHCRVAADRCLHR